jgi:hypothetical protein
VAVKALFCAKRLMLTKSAVDINIILGLFMVLF